jgi:hypothetical protein
MCSFLLGFPAMYVRMHKGWTIQPALLPRPLMIYYGFHAKMLNAFLVFECVLSFP